MKTLLVIFLSVFIAELGDKTQLATLLFATDHSLSRAAVFAAASAALVLSSLLAVLFGAQISRVIPPPTLRLAAGIGFIVIGAWLLLDVRR